MPDSPSLSIPDPQPFGDLLSLKGRVAIVTGGTRGIGAADRCAVCRRPGLPWW